MAQFISFITEVQLTVNSKYFLNKNDIIININKDTHNVVSVFLEKNVIEKIIESVTVNDQFEKFIVSSDQNLNQKYTKESKQNFINFLKLLLSHPIIVNTLEFNDFTLSCINTITHSMYSNINHIDNTIKINNIKLSETSEGTSYLNIARNSIILEKKSNNSISSIIFENYDNNKKNIQDIKEKIKHNELVKQNLRKYYSELFFNLKLRNKIISENELNLIKNVIKKI